MSNFNPDIICLHVYKVAAMQHTNALQSYLRYVFNSELCLCFIDLSKAYDSVSREALMAVLRKYGVPGHTVGGDFQLYTRKRGKSLSIAVLPYLFFCRQFFY